MEGDGSGGEGRGTEGIVGGVARLRGGGLVGGRGCEILGRFMIGDVCNNKY